MKLLRLLGALSSVEGAFRGGPVPSTFTSAFSSSYANHLPNWSPTPTQVVATTVAPAALSSSVSATANATIGFARVAGSGAEGDQTTEANKGQEGLAAKVAAKVQAAANYSLPGPFGPANTPGPPPFMEKVPSHVAIKARAVSMDASIAASQALDYANWQLTVPSPQAKRAAKEAVKAVKETAQANEIAKQAFRIAASLDGKLKVLRGMMADATWAASGAINNVDIPRVVIPSQIPLPAVTTGPPMAGPPPPGGFTTIAPR